ncbi:WYL domain-containing protein [Anaerotignum propionicum]|uniref:WYL domain-containing protein n=1 Tax=Anaerotignum propionicum TaxID=28446 RepID=UPI00289F5E6B|nr:WYL domain-containing protein [Anaerotignum propionicum]
MNLFDETENKYYEFISHLLQNGQRYSKNDVNYLVEKYLSGEPDFDVIDTVFADKEGEELIFYIENGKFVPILENNFPIRMGTIEQQAAKSLLDNEYVKHFLSEETISKLEECTRNVDVDWSTSEIAIKNVFAGGVTGHKREYGPIISLIAKAIKEHRAIVYDNVREDKFEYRNVSVFPVRIEFSIKNDRFRVSSYEPKQHRFIKMNLDTMDNIYLSDDIWEEDLEVEYKDFLKTNTRTVKLDIDPVSHAIERCFRVFSYYDRKARYDKEENKYRLEISYLRFDEAEIIKDILSLGGYATLIEPRQLQKEVYRRVLAASKLYES